jgi:tetratricopeptide (TPR) repeat protein
MKTSRPMASPRVLTRETLHTELQTAGQRSDRANSAHSAKHVCSESRRIIAAIAILVAVVSVICTTAMPVFAQLPQGLSEALENQKAGRLKEAVEIYTEVITKNPRSAEAHNWRGMAYEDLGQLDQALEDFNKAIEISPDYADAYNNRGEIYRKKNTIPQAMTDYRKAAELDKNFAEAHHNMGLMNEIQKKDALAVKEYETYLKLKPDAADKQQILDKIEALKKTAATQPAPHPAAAEKKPGERPGIPKALPEKKAAEVPGVQKSLPEKKAGERPGVPKPGMPMMPPTPPGGVDLGVPGVPPIPVSPDMLAALAAGGGLMGLIVSILSYLFPAIMLFLIAKKTNTSLPWLAFIPIAQVILALNIARKPIWWLLLFLLPVLILPASLLEAAIPTGGILPLAVLLLALIVAIVATLFVCLGIARERGKSGIWGVLLFIPCTSPIALGYLGLSK